MIPAEAEAGLSPAAADTLAWLLRAHATGGRLADTAAIDGERPPVLAGAGRLPRCFPPVHRRGPPRRRLINWAGALTALLMTLAEIPQCRSAKFPAAAAMVMLGRYIGRVMCVGVLGVSRPGVRRVQKLVDLAGEVLGGGSGEADGDDDGVVVAADLTSHARSGGRPLALVEPRSISARNGWSRWSGCCRARRARSGFGGAGGWWGRWRRPGRARRCRGPVRRGRDRCGRAGGRSGRTGRPCRRAARLGRRGRRRGSVSAGGRGAR